MGSHGLPEYAYSEESAKRTQWIFFQNGPENEHNVRFLSFVLLKAKGLLISNRTFMFGFLFASSKTAPVMNVWVIPSLIPQ